MMRWPCTHGHGTCAHCKEPWCRVEGHSIAISESSGMFPVCTRCYPTLSADEMELYIRQLGGSWFQWAQSAEEARKIDDDVAAAVAAMRADKAVLA